MPQREPEQRQPEQPTPPSWESAPWTPEERSAAQPEEERPAPLRLADQNEHVVDLPRT